MRRFHFNLQGVLHYRQALEDQARLHLAGAQQRYETERGTLAALAANLEDRYRGAVPVGPLDVEEWGDYLRFMQVLAEQKKAQEEVVARRAGEVREAVEEVRHRVRERRTLELLREKRWEAWRYEAGRQEQVEGDEAALLRFARHTLERR